MAVQAYVLVKCAPGTPHQVVDALTKLRGVEVAHAVTGVYDVIAFLRAESMAEMGDLLTHHIQRLKGILKTNTNVVVQRTAAHRSMESNRRPRMI